MSGIRAFDLTRVLAGPTSGRVLAENGADVLHVAAPHLPYQAELLMDTGHGKRCAWIDLRESAGVETMKTLLKDADIFTQGYRPGTLAARGFSPEQVAALRPGIVCVSLCAYGHEGPWSSRRGFDSIVQNVTGLAATQASLAKPRNLPVQALDYIAGYLGARWARWWRWPAGSNRAAPGRSACRWSRSRTGWRTSARSTPRKAPPSFPTSCSCHSSPKASARSAGCDT